MSIPAYATNAVTCLAVKPGERFQALVDEPFADIGTRLCDAALAAGAASAACVVVPDRARPLLGSYEPLVASLTATDAICFWFVHIHDGEFAGFRKPLYTRAREIGTRIAFGGHMDHSILEHEMAADYGALRELTARLGERMAGSARVRVTTPGGTDCTFDVTGREWKLDDGVLDRPGAFGNLPAGEAFVAPLATGADGVCVIDRSIALGDVGLVDEPIRLTFERGRIVSVEGGRSADSTRAAIAASRRGRRRRRRARHRHERGRAHHGQHHHRREGARHRARRVRRQRERELWRRQPRRHPRGRRDGGRDHRGRRRRRDEDRRPRVTAQLGPGPN